MSTINMEGPRRRYPACDAGREYVAAVTEFARTGVCEAWLEPHLARCRVCATSLESQRFLEGALGRFATGLSAAGPSSGVTAAVAAAYQARQKERMRLTVAIAAGLTLAGLLGSAGFLRWKPAPPQGPPAAVQSEISVPRRFAPAQESRALVPTPRRAQTRPQRQVEAVSPPAATDSATEPFIAIPYTLPLLAGERAWVVRMELLPAALLSTGFPLPAVLADAGALQTDVVVGEDGRARAIRVLTAARFEQR